MPNPQLDAILSDLLDSDFAASPVSATGFGLTDYDDKLDDVSADALRARDAAAATFLARLDAIGDDGLTTDEAIDRDLARAVLRGRLIMAPFEAWKRDPVTYSGPITSGVFALFLHRLRPDADLAEAATARLDAVGALVDAGIANLDAGLAHPLIVERGRNAAMGALRYVRDLAWQDLPDDPARERMRAAGGRAAAELERYVAHLEAFLPRASGSWQLGEEGYTRILREREVLPDDARQLRERGQREFDRLDAEMTELAKDATGNPDYVAVVRENDADHPATEQAMLEAYTEWTEKARSFLVDTGLVTFPEGETCAVVPSPVFQRPVLGVASYIAPPAFSDRLKGHFFVPFAPDGATDEEIQGRLSNNSFGSIPTTSVHEAYPGHHWHLVMRKSAPSSRVRKVYGTPYFNEGWALYTERVMRERGFFENPLHELQHLSATIFRAARIIVDTSLHLGEMTFDEAVAFMRDKAALPEPVAIAEVGRYCWWPTQASSYLTGCLEILEIRRRYLDARGFAGVAAKDVPVDVLRDFHDTIARAGSLPLGLADRAVMATLP
ncbi:MAG TPA: DUF885 domain-containing protein [Candidatus Limnocylindrales bacterium]|jgi:uncharacterized protein (DUF885 family)